jgi:hypothetical protein
VERQEIVDECSLFDSRHFIAFTSSREIVPSSAPTTTLPPSLKREILRSGIVELVGNVFSTLPLFIVNNNNESAAHLLVSNNSTVPLSQHERRVSSVNFVKFQSFELEEIF